MCAVRLRVFGELHLKHMPDFDGAAKLRPFEEEVRP